MNDSELDKKVEESPYDAWACPSCGNETFRLSALGRRSVTVICTKCGNEEHFGE